MHSEIELLKKKSFFVFIVFINNALTEVDYDSFS